MLVQMGYVVLFSAAFPLAGVCALANNLLEIRSDAFKLVHVHQRPFGQRVANIGTWQTSLSFLSLAAVIVNCTLIGLSGQVSRLWPGLSGAQTIVLIVALEHVMLGLRSALTWILPELPTWLAAEIARAEHCRHEMQVKGTSPRQTPPTPTSTASVSRPNEEETPPDMDFNDQLDDEINFPPSSPRFREFDDRDIINANIEADVSINEALNRGFTPDSPVVQVCSYCNCIFRNSDKISSFSPNTASPQSAVFRIAHQSVNAELTTGHSTICWVSEVLSRCSKCRITSFDKQPNQRPNPMQPDF